MPTDAQCAGAFGAPLRVHQLQYMHIQPFGAYPGAAVPATLRRASQLSHWLLALAALPARPPLTRRRPPATHSLLPAAVQGSHAGRHLPDRQRRRQLRPLRPQLVCALPCGVCLQPGFPLRARRLPRRLPQPRLRRLQPRWEGMRGAPPLGSTCVSICAHDSALEPGARRPTPSAGAPAATATAACPSQPHRPPTPTPAQMAHARAAALRPRR